MNTGVARRTFYEDEHTALRDSVSRFLAHARQSSSVPTLKAAADQELLGIAVPESCGGAGVSDLRFPMVMIEESMRLGNVGWAVLLAMQSMVVVPALNAVHGWDGRDELLSGIAKGTAYVGVAGAHAPLTVSRNGDQIVVDGVADTVLSAAIATHFLVVCRTDGGEDLIVVVEAGQPGVHVAPRTPMLGADGAGSADVSFEQVCSSDGRIATSDASGAARDLELFLAALTTAGAAAALAWTSEYITQRKVFGRELGEFENTRSVMARLGTGLVLAQSTLRQALSARAAAPLPAVLTAALAVAGSTLFTDATDEGLQLHGGYGYMHEYPIAQSFADAEFFHLLIERLGVARRCIVTAETSL